MIRRFARLTATVSPTVCSTVSPTVSSTVVQGAILGAVLLCGFAPLAAQQAVPVGEPVASASYPVVQSTTPSPTRMLNAALARLARDPRDMAALVDAGSAALDLGDTDAAIGFFTRAEQVAPGAGGVRARIGIAMLRASQPFEAIRWFDLADQAGFSRAEMATERGLAYDLVGDNTAAQRQYQLALSGGQNDEASRRYALSLVIAGDRRGAELVLQPLIERRDRAAWRVRTFIMAIAGQSEEAEGIARATMPADLASGISPYLRYMPRLTAAQQAAAANLGRFPRAAEIGRDDPQIVQYAALHPRAPRVDAGLIPAGPALGSNGRETRESRAKRRRPGRDEKRGTVLAAATPPAVSVPWGLQPAAPTSAPTRVPTLAPPLAPPLAPTLAPRPATAPVVLSRLDVPPGTPLAPARQPVAKPAPEIQLTARPIPIPAPTPIPAPIPALPQAQASKPSPPRAVQPAGPATTSSPAPVLAVAAPPAPFTTPAPTPAPEPSPAPTSIPAAAPITALASVAPADFRSMFDGFKPPEQETAPPAESVDLSTIDELRNAAAKVPAKASGNSKSPANPKAKDRGDRPDGPTAVSRTSDDDGPATSVVPALAGPAKSAKDKAAKAKAEAEKAAKNTNDKAALAKACLEQANKLKSGQLKGGQLKGSRSKGGKSNAGKSALAKDLVCKTEPGKDKDKKAKGQPSHASRIWVQVLTGANRDVMGREWQRLQRDAAGLRGRKPYITPWRSNYRLLTGPFESDAAAQTFLGQLSRDGVSGFQWTSPAGQAVDSLSLK